jgi:hypothetical protein
MHLGRGSVESFKECDEYTIWRIFEVRYWIFERRAMKLVRARLCQRSLVGMDGCEGVNWRKKQEEAQED